MVLDACAAILIARELEVPKDKIFESLRTFKNAKRRFAIEKYNDITIIDDYAHHPTEIKVTLEAARQKYPNKKLIVVFRPNTYSRTKDFTDDFAEALQVADKVFLTAIDCNREQQSDYPGITSYTILDKIEGGELISNEDIYKLGNEKNQVVCFMSCAHTEDLIKSYKEYLDSIPKEEE